MMKNNQQSFMAEIETFRAVLHGLLDTLEALAATVETGEPISTEGVEFEYPLSISPHIFKGRKPAAVTFNGERVDVKSWRRVYTEIMHRCVAEKYDTLMELRGKISGRDRVFLAAKPDGMTFPIQLADELFVEAFFDTEGLIHVLTKRILDAVRFDYSRISIALKPRR